MGRQANFVALYRSGEPEVSHELRLADVFAEMGDGVKEASDAGRGQVRGVLRRPTHLRRQVSFGRLREEPFDLRERGFDARDKR